MVTLENCLRFWSEKCIKWVNSPLHCELLNFTCFLGKKCVQVGNMHVDHVGKFWY